MNEDTLASLSTAGGEAEREALIDAAQRMGDALGQEDYSAATEILDAEIDTVGYNFVSDFATPSWRNCSRDYSR